MFEELTFIIGFLLFSLFISYILLNYTPEPLNKIVMALAAVGIIIHELCHALMCLITNAKIEKITLVQKTKTKDRKEKYMMTGNVKISDRTKLTFLQALLIALAPLFFMFWLFFFLWDQILNPQLNLILFFTYIFIMVSIVIACAPSIPDIACISQAFKDDPRYSLYQILLVILSLGGVWILINTYQLIFFHEIMIYALIMVFYYAFKYSFKGINKLLHIKTDPKKRKCKALIIRRFKPVKPSKLGIEEPHW